MKLSQDKQRFYIVCILLLWCAALITYRMFLATDALAVGLLWNLFLAAVPLFWSSAFRAADLHKRPLLAGTFFLLWLLFLPNAPYILTDLIHLAPKPHVPLWFLLAMLLSCAGTGTLLGFLSLVNVHDVIEQKFGAVAGWAVAISSMMLCGFGIYIGRFLRWNSWNVLNRPVELMKTVVGQFFDSGPHPHPAGVTLVFGTGLVIGYLALRVIAVPARAE